ncbi:MAG: hypothetical protein AAFY72_12445 [Cyanobacteria bacterium J06649_4]
MSSPFSTLEEFNGAIDGPTEGAIYTFANAPAINIIALLVSVGIFLWFMVKTYTHAPGEKSSSMDRSLNSLSSFIVIGLLSFVAAEQLQKPSASEQAHQVESRSGLASAAKRAPLTPFGMIGGMMGGMTGLKRPSRRKSKYRHRQSRRPRR